METVIEAPPAHDRAFCDAMLPKVSRTFAVCIRLLPARLQRPVLTAYLLCRVADTIEDTATLAPDVKDALLAAFRASLDAGGPDADALRKAFPAPTTDEEHLTHDADAVLREFRRLSTVQQAAIRPSVQEMCSGMAEFARRQRLAAGGPVTALETVEDLDRYCYFVAGTVGHLLTELFRAHAASITPSRYRRLKHLATSFGLGLQLTNIIKDVSDDRRRGWAFVPRQLCHVAGIRPEELHDGRHREEALRVMRALIDKAKGHLCDALEYSTVLPRRLHGIRLFCLTSLYFAVRTLRLAERDARLLDPAHKVKITRRDVARTVGIAKVIAPSDVLVRGYFRLLAGPEWRCS